MKVYFVSGLGADERVFKHIQLPNGYEPVHLPWIAPIPAETLAQYALRMAQKIDRQQPFALVGLSMGGMVVSEISRHYAPVKTILISSIPSAGHLPVYFKWVKNISLHKAIPVGLLKSSAIAKRLFTTELPEDKTLLKQMIRDSDAQFIRWAVNAIVHWNNVDLPGRYIHIHGTRDEVLPIRYTKPTHIIPNAGHMLVLTHAAIVNKWLEEQLS